MGACDTINKGNQPEDYGNIMFREQQGLKIDATKFYDVIVPIQSIKDITAGWKVKLSERFKNDYENLVNERALRIGIIGNSNKGKSSCFLNYLKLIYLQVQV